MLVDYFVKDPITFISVGVVVLTLRIRKNNILEGVLAKCLVLKLQSTKLGKHHNFHMLIL